MMPHLLKSNHYRDSVVLTPKYMKNLAKQVNAEIDNLAKELEVPKKHFAKMSTEVHPLVVSAARKFRILAKPVSAFAEEIQTAYRGVKDMNRYGHVEVKLMRPVIWASKNPEVTGLQCIAFLNLDIHSVNDMHSENPWTPNNCLSVSNSLEQDLQHEDRKQAWLPFSRGRKRLNVRKPMSLTRVLARFVRINGNLIDPKTVDNLAQKMLDVYKPMELHEANDIDSMRKMYTKYSSDTPGSCMDSTHSFYMDRPDQPVDWYAMCPNTRGYYVSRGDTVLARTIVNLNQADNKWYFTRIYATRDVYSRELEQQLRDIDIIRAESTKQDEIRRSVKDVMFDIDIGYHNGGEVCPIPYFDFVPASTMWIRKHEDVIQCLLKPDGAHPEGKNWVNPNIASTNGAHVFGDCDEYGECYQCQTELHIESDDYLRAVDGNIFCCSDCAAEDYIRWHTSDNCEWRRYTTPRENGGIQCYHEPTVFSNIEAGIRSGEGVFVYYHPWADTENVLIRSRWANDQGWGETVTQMIPLHAKNPITGKLYREDGNVNVCYLSSYRTCFGGYQELTPDGFAPKFLSIQGTRKRFVKDENLVHGERGLRDFVKINKSRIFKFDVRGYEAGQINNLFDNIYKDFMGTDNALSCAETTQGVNIKQQTKEGI